MAEQNIQSWSLDTSLPSLQLFGVKASPLYQHLPLKYWLLSRELLDLSSVTETALFGQKDWETGFQLHLYHCNLWIFSFLTCQMWGLVSTSWFTRSPFTTRLWIQVLWSWIKCSFADSSTNRLIYEVKRPLNPAQCLPHGNCPLGIRWVMNEQRKQCQKEEEWE